MKIAICGYGRAGKDTACEWLGQHTHMHYTVTGSSSRFMAPYVFKEWGKANYPTVDACYNDRQAHRKMWASLIAGYNVVNATKMYEDILEENDIVNGIRRVEELQACQQKGLIQLTIWIRRPGITESKSSCTITEEDCDLTVLNDRDLPHLFQKLSRLALSWGELNR